MGFPITSGDADMNIDECTRCCPDQPLGWHTGLLNLGIVLIVFNLWACSALTPRGDLGMSDLQLTVDVLHASVSDARRTLEDLRSEIELRNQELAETQVSRAQLEGRVREAEHRLREARHVIRLQREELVASRVDRERIARSGAVLQGQLKQLRKQLSKIESQASEGGVVPTIMEFPVEKLQRPVPVNLKTVVSFDDRRVFSHSDEAMPDAAVIDRGAIADQPLLFTSHSQVMIKQGDTLWSLAQRHRTSVPQLMAVNALSTDYIQAGQSLWLPESVADGSEYERK